MKPSPKRDDFHFEGFDSPNTTPVPDLVFDRLLARLGEAELKALLYIIRRTFGFKKDRDPISFNQFLRGIVTRDGRVLDNGCGVRDRTTLSKALKSLDAKGIVVGEKGVDERGENVTTIYRLRFREGSGAANTAIPADAVGDSYPHQRVVGRSYHGGMERPLSVVGDSHSQETEPQQTVKQHSNVRAGLREGEEQHARDVQTVSTSHERPNEWHGDSDMARREPVTESVDRGMTPLRHEIARRRREQNKAVGDRTEQTDGTALAAPVPSEQRQPRTHWVQQDETYKILQAYLADFGREFNDRAPLRSSTARAHNLMRRSGLDRGRFLDELHTARAIVKERSSAVRSRVRTDGFGIPVKAKMAFFFAVLEDRLGLRGGTEGISAAGANSSPDASADGEADG